jgi:hypothetical protein
MRGGFRASPSHWVDPAVGIEVPPRGGVQQRGGHLQAGRQRVRVVGGWDGSAATGLDGISFARG